MNTQPVFKQPAPELRATIYYLAKEEGGRSTWIGSGYRGQFFYDGNNWDACQTFINQERCYPGEEVDCYLTTLSPQYHLHQFFIGKAFEIREGAKVVGRGVITEIIRSDFNR